MTSRFAAPVFAALLALAAASATGCTDSAAQEPVRAAAPPKAQVLKFDPATLERLGVSSEPAGQTGPAQRIDVPGTLEYVADRYAQVGTLVEGRVTAVHVTAGDHVKRGQALATVLVPAIVTAQADALSAQAALRVARDHARREEALLASQLTTAREAELARGEVIRAEADLAAAQSKLKLLGSALPETAQGIQPTGSVVLRAPIDGVVVNREVVVGAFLQPHETAFVVADPSALWAVLDVYESDLRYLRVGAEAELRIDAFPGKAFTGRVSTVEPQLAKSTRAVRARVVVDNSEGVLKPGLFLRASVPIATPAADALVVPGAAVQPLGGKDVVFVELSPGQYEVRVVTVARKTSQLAEIASGVRAGERIVVHGAFVLRAEATRQ